MSKKRKKQKQRRQRPELAYYIWRRSRVDDTTFFSLDGRRIRFEKPHRASWFMNMFDADQKARIVRRPVRPDDVPFVEAVGEWLPDGVTPEEYTAAIDRTVQGRDVSRRAARAFIRWQQRKHNPLEV